MQVGDIPPPRLGTDRNGDRINLEEMSGKIVVISFWATWCPPCLKELPVLEAIHNSIGEDRLEVIAVNTE
ncbi:MAG: TlpA disulfide reductase family protein, partial [Gammaproteobacteria bacterium]|nr:TlpA disulfide reductase family protein [Gammaproteobacteria bacterium]